MKMNEDEYSNNISFPPIKNKDFNLIYQFYKFSVKWNFL